MVLISGPRSRATMVVAILVMLAGAWRENASCAYSRLPEASSRTATWGAVTCGGESAATFWGPLVVGLGCVATSGCGMRMYGPTGGSGKWAGGDATSQKRCWAIWVALAVGSGAAGVAVGASVGTRVGRGVGTVVGPAVGGPAVGGPAVGGPAAVRGASVGVLNSRVEPGFANVSEVGTVIAGRPAVGRAMVGSLGDELTSAGGGIAA